MSVTTGLSADQVQQFQLDGYTLLEGLFTPDECDHIADLIEQARFELMLGEPADGQLSYRPMLHLANPDLQQVCCDPRWSRVVGTLLGPNARLYWEQCVTKPPEARTELPWHQDNGYTPIHPEHYLTCWLALDDADEANGCLWVVPGSHHLGAVTHRNGDGPFRVALAPDDPRAAGAVPVPVPRGSVLCFSSLVLHRSGPNISGRQRRAWIIQYCDAAAASGLSGRPLDDRLRVSVDGEWLAEPYRDRDFDLLSVLANYDQR
ncbi:MAG: phytanoyl-CoA dioxygenase family protein [Acidimicrobiales bacterium]|nr:phytanoyl-CoA dioxygenase family protein [Acidimicrobiales bacterium]